jgi:hypothetical protein
MTFTSFLLGAVPCPPPVMIQPSAPPPKPKYQRYDDPTLQQAYARVVGAVRELSVPIYGTVFSDDAADKTARGLIDAVRAMPQSSEMQARARCALEPGVRGAAVAGVQPYVIGLGIATVAALGLSTWALLRR